MKFIYLILLTLSPVIVGAKGGITHNPLSRSVEIRTPDNTLSLVVDYSQGCKLSELTIKGENSLSPTGVHTGFRTRGGFFSSSDSSGDITVENTEDEVTIRNITFGDNAVCVNETWNFRLSSNKIGWKIKRTYSGLAKLEETAFPEWNFKSLDFWKGGIIDNGGVVWCKYLADENDTYGVHTGGVTFWNPRTGDALRISAGADGGNSIASKYSQNDRKAFTFTQSVTDTELEPRYELNRFVRQKADVFAPFDVQKGTVGIALELQYIEYSTEYSRGILPGIDELAVRELLNTTGRYGVVDNTIVGANGWTTNWKCLHEPFFAQIGMALADENYTHNMSSSLDSERDHAITPEGRVLSRWHNAGEDQMPGTYNYKTGYYEAKWGYTVDSQTGYIINTAEQFDLCGDVDWLRSHKTSCEQALDWLIKRDTNQNGIFEMVNSSTAEQQASDWLDIVWASFENAFVNAQMYEALRLWADCERLLGDEQKSAYYTSVASRLKENFNKPVGKGGFWSPEKKQYVYWRDKDGSIHGDNLVTPVNFAVIAFGLCDDTKRIALILDEIEKRTSAENLFHWPLCFDSYKREEVHANNWPFPTYENGDIFPTWGYLGVRAYVGHDKEIALKYIRNLLEQYHKDGLSSQRYSRTTQQGLGSDILAGISTSVTALYRDIYGIRPKWNRMGLEPNMSAILNGTSFTYRLRGTDYHLELSVDDYVMYTNDFRIKCKASFGANHSDNRLVYYPDNKEFTTLVIDAASRAPVHMEIDYWKPKAYSWTITSADDYDFTLTGLSLNTKYRLSVNKEVRTVEAGQDGCIRIKQSCLSPMTFQIRKL